MTPRDWIELIGVVLTLIVTTGGTIWAMVGYVNKAAAKLNEDIGRLDEKRSSGVRDLHDKIDGRANNLDGKFTAVMAEVSKVKDNFVRRDDLTAHLERLENSNRELREAIRISSGEMREAITAMGERFDKGFLEFTRIVTQRGIAQL